MPCYVFINTYIGIFNSKLTLLVLIAHNIVEETVNILSEKCLKNIFFVILICSFNVPNIIQTIKYKIKYNNFELGNW